MKKLLTLATTLTLLLSLTIPALADDNSSTANPKQPSTSIGDTIRTQYKQYMEPIRELQRQEKELRNQIHSTRNQVHQLMNSARKAKNYTTLSAALNDMIAMQNDIVEVTNATKACLTEWQQYYRDRQAKDETAIVADLQNLQTDITNKISAMQKVQADLQQVCTDLTSGQAVTAPTASTL